MAVYTIELGKAIDNGLINWDDVMSSFPDGGDAEWKAEVSKRIRDYYWFREIGFETPQMFSFYMKRTLEEIGPYYVELKKVNELELGVDPLTTFNENESVQENGSDETTNEGTQNTTNTGSQTRTDDLSSDSTNDVTSNTKSENNNTSNTTNNGYNKNYAIPMRGGSSGTGPGGFSDGFATSGVVTNNEGSDISEGTSKTDNTTNGTSSVKNTGTQSLETDSTIGSTSNSTQNSTKQNSIIRDKKGNSVPKFELMSKYRDVIINLNMMLVKDKNIAECFMGVF